VRWYWIDVFFFCLLLSSSSSSSSSSHILACRAEAFNTKHAQFDVKGAKSCLYSLGEHCVDSRPEKAQLSVQSSFHIQHPNTQCGMLKGAMN
jgi:hypothetical protein